MKGNDKRLGGELYSTPKKEKAVEIISTALFLHLIKGI